MPMKNRLILSFAFLFIAFSLSAQDFEIVSVESLPADMSAREEMKTDHNDRQCALLRIATQNIAPNQREAGITVPIAFLKDVTLGHIGQSKGKGLNEVVGIEAESDIFDELLVVAETELHGHAAAQG